MKRDARIVFAWTVTLCCASMAAAPAPARSPQQAAVEAQGQAVLAQIRVAAADETKFDSAYALFLPWQPQAQAFPALGGLVAQASLGWGQGIKAAAGRDVHACAQHDLNQIARLAGLAAWVTNHPLVLVGPGVDLAALLEAARSCATFQLEWESTIDIPTENGLLKVAVKSTVMLIADITASRLRLSGDAPIDYVSQKWPSPKGCSVTSTGQSGTLGIEPVEIALDTTVSFKETVAGTAKVTLAIKTPPVEHMTAACPDGTDTGDAQMWFAGWTARRAIQGQLFGPLAFAALPMRSAAVALIKSMTGAGPGPIAEDGEIRLRHTPR